MKILGIAHDVHICSAALIENGEVIFAAPEERFDRKKMSRVFPKLAIQECLKHAKCDLEDIDEIAIAWNPALELATIGSGFTESRRTRSEHLMQVPAQFYRLVDSRAGSKKADKTLAKFEEHFLNSEKIKYVDHYDAHLGNALGLSGFRNCAAAIMDGRGERDTALFANIIKGNVDILNEVTYPHSLGLFYGAITHFLGFRPDSDEWKVMALSAYAKGKNPYTSKMQQLFKISKNSLSFEVDLNYFQYYNISESVFYSERFIETFGQPRKRDDKLENRHFLIAQAMQATFEKVMVSLLNGLHARTGHDRLVVSGGCFMNSLFNGKITKKTRFKEVFIGSCPDDSGTSLGAALWRSILHEKRKVNKKAIRHNFWGRKYSDQQCLDAVNKYKLPNASAVENPSNDAAVDLANGKLIGWFQGRSEFGQRALGNRSILADARSTKAKDLVNLAIKYRESFRPFAPAILEEFVNDYFDCDSNEKVYFMEKVFMFHKKVQKLVPAVVHGDGTGRLQTVDKTTNPRYYRLIKEFHKRTNIPIVLNTSFNLNGEPNVDSPEDAIRTFYSCGLDVLYLGNVRVEK